MVVTSYGRNKKRRRNKKKQEKANNSPSYRFAAIKQKISAANTLLNFDNLILNYLMTGLSRFIVSPIKLQRYRTFQRSKFNFNTCRDNDFVVLLRVQKILNVCLRYNLMGITIYRLFSVCSFDFYRIPYIA